MKRFVIFFAALLPSVGALAHVHITTPNTLSTFLKDRQSHLYLEYHRGFAKACAQIQAFDWSSRVLHLEAID